MIGEVPCLSCGAPVVREFASSSRRYCDPCVVVRKREQGARADAKRRQPTPMTKTCPWCGVGFIAVKNVTNRRYCDACSGLDKHGKRCNAPGASRKHHLKHKYGLTLDAYALLHGKQRGRCAVCSTEADRLDVDHDHSCCPGDRSCGACIRGLLCRSCNVAIGHFKDDPALLLKAAEYLVFQGESHEAETEVAECGALIGCLGEEKITIDVDFSQVTDAIEAMERLDHPILETIKCPECARDIYLDTCARPFAEFLRHRQDVMVQHCADYPDEHSILTQKFVTELLEDVSPITQEVTDER